MAYNGWLIKIGEPDKEKGYKIPMKYIKAESYSVYVNMQDLDDWTDADGYLHRNAVELKALKVEFETPAMLTNFEFNDLMFNIGENFKNKKARECYITAYIPEYDDYVTQLGYLTDFTPQIYSTYREVIHYNSIRFTFIGGVYGG